MANVGSLRTTISLDSAQFNQSMSGVNRQLKSLQQEQKAVTSTGTGFARGVDELRKKSDVLGRTFELQQKKVRELRKRYEESKKATGENSKETQKAMTAYQKAQAEMNKTENALKGVTEEIKRQSNPWLNLEKNLTNTGEKLTAAGDKMTTFGRNMSMKVTAPIVGLGGAMLKTGIEFESSMSNVQAVSGATGSDLEKLEGSARELGATTSKSASEAADALGYMALAGWDTTQMMDGLEPVLRLSEAGNIDLARASDLATDSMSALQIGVQDLPKYLDNVAEASRSSNTSIDQLMQAYVTAGGNLAQFNVPLEESTAMLGLLANRGLKGSEAGRSLNAIMVNLTSGAGRAGTALEELEISAFDADGQFIGMEETLRLVKDRTKDMTDEQKANYISMIAGKEHLKSFQGLLAGIDDEYGDLKGSVSEADGALDNMAKTMQDNAQGNINRLKSSFEELSIQFTEHMLPAFTRGVEGLTDLVDWFGSLDKSTQDNIIKMGAFAAAIGPASLMLGGITKTAGGTFTTLGKLAGVIGRSGKGGGAAGKATLAGGLGLLGAGGGPVALATLAIAGLTAGGIALHSHMKKDVIPEIDLFGDSVSDSTEKAVGGFMELNDEATVQLNELAWSGKEVSEEMAESLTGTFDQMGQQIVDGLEQRKDESLSAIQEMFDGAKDISDEEQTEILNSATESFEERIKATEEATARIDEIYKTAAEENRKTTTEEKQEVNRIQEEMKNNAIEVLSENEQEQQVILERMKDQAEDIGKRQMADTIKNSIETKEGVIAEAENQYYLQKTTYENMRDELEGIEEGLTDQLIKDAERRKNETVKEAENRHQGVIDEAKEQNPKLIEQVNLTTGEILSKWEKLGANSAIEFAKIYSKGKGIYGDIKDVFKQAITMPSPNLGSTSSLFNSARAAWKNVRDIFTQKISMSAPTARTPSLQHKTMPTNRFNYDGNDSFEGGLTWIGEKGFELARHGDQWGMFDFGLANLPQGTQIFTHDESKKILSSLNNIPGYATGVSPTGEADRIANRLNQPQQSQGEAVIYTTVINQMDGREIGRYTYKSVTEFQERDKKVKEKFRG
ncbi:phage tail tape measure protein, TP901 family, core region [Gracilibacillus orientalis]|uniref:Phage tail tape measure protein, TP901 family, core region n=1 Tax=Gracilibacillus orientalis TaxID=334253 RepID=A0A1I4HAG3_9BACI|nr:phage tail tape measure protein [Gracilibacillus orientalis]SFL38770.1 phage tail tape measure protein, TP901 family, core region [Gracilibacillus orientalis]